jgi:hypothetical protein
MALNQTQGVVLAIFGANAGGHLTGLNANAEANGLSSLAADLSASAGFILGVDLSSDAVFTSTILENLGVEEGTAGYTLAESFFSTNLTAGTSRGALIASAVEYLLGDNIDASLTSVATTFTASVDAGVEYSQGEGATVFGVAALQEAAGNTSGSVEGQTFVLTTDDDTPALTAGDDTVTATTATLSNDDRIVDGSQTDNDVLNITATRALPTAMDVTNVENINIDWDSFARPDVDLTEVTGATVTLTSAKSGYLGHADFDGVGENVIVTGAGVVGDVSVDDAEDTTITLNNARSLTGTNGDGLITIVAPVATDITYAGADDYVVTALLADDISLTGGSDTMTLNLGVDADVTATAATDGVINLNSDVDITVTLETASVFETVNTGGSGTISLTADIGDLDDAIVNASGSTLVVADAIADAGLQDLDVASIRFETTAGGAAALDVASGQNLVFETALGGAITLQTVAADDSSSDSINVTLETATGANAFIIDVADREIETFTVTIDPNSDFDNTTDFVINGIQGNAAADTVIVLESADSDVEVTLTAADASEIDASEVAGDFELTAQTTDETITIIGSAAGDNTISDIKAGRLATTVGSYIGGSGDDDVTFTSILGEISAVVGEGDNALVANTLTEGSAYFSAGSGDDTLSATGLTTGTIFAELGDGDNEVTLGGVIDGGEVTIVTGSGDDTITIDGAATDVGEITFHFGTGTDRLVLADDADLTDYTLEITGLEEIELAARDVGAELNSALLSGQSYTILSSGAAGTPAARLGVELQAGTSSFDGSSLTISDSIATAVLGLDIDVTTAGTDYTIVGSDGSDLITTGDGDDIITGGAGADTIDGGLGENTYVFTSGSGSTTVIDSIAAFVTGTDSLSLGVAGTADNFAADTTTRADGAAALVAANIALNGTVQYVFTNDIADASDLAPNTGDGLLFIDYDLDGAADQIIALVGLQTAGDVVASDIVA